MNSKIWWKVSEKYGIFKHLLLLFLTMCMCVFGYVHVSTDTWRGRKRWILGPPGAAFTGSCDPSDVGSGN